MGGQSGHEKPERSRHVTEKPTPLYGSQSLPKVQDVLAATVLVIGTVIASPRAVRTY